MYFTTLSWVGLLMYSVLAFVFTIVEALGKASPLGHLWKIVCLFHSFLYTTIVTFPFLVTGMYWAALTDGTEWTRLWPTWNNISFHVLNALFAAFEVVVPCTNLMPWCHLIGLYILLALYVALSSVNFQLRGWWPYPFLGEVMKREERSWIWPLVVITGTAGVFLIVQFCVWLRSSVRRGRSGPRRSRLPSLILSDHTSADHISAMIRVRAGVELDSILNASIILSMPSNISE